MVVSSPILSCPCKALDTLEGEIFKRLAISFMVGGFDKINSFGKNKRYKIRFNPPKVNKE